MELIFFLIFAVIAIASAVGVVTFRSPVHSALSLIICFLQVAALFILLRSPFLAVMQVFIYVGAVVVLFLFAVLILNLGREDMKERIFHGSPLVLVVIVGFVLEVGYLILTGKLTAPIGPYTEQALALDTEVIGTLLFTKYLFPFEVVSLLLLVALVGAVILAMKEKGEE
ncbi:MAG: NADH-quinone oxidoreductase subunit J [Thermodesulfobacteriota bacterium]